MDDKDPHGQSPYLSKSRLLIEMEYNTSYQMVTSLVLEWLKAKPDNKDLKAMARELTRIGVIVTGYQMELQGVERMVGQYREQKLKYQHEAYEASKKLADYEEKYFKQ